MEDYLTIGEISKLTAVSISTLRYYDKEGLFQELNKEPSGIRRFDEQSLEALRVIECLKKSGMQLKIVSFIHEHSDNTYEFLLAFYLQNLLLI